MAAPSRAVARLLPSGGPGRVLAATVLVNMIGYGMYLTAGVVYFTRSVHLPGGEVGLGLSVAGAVALAAGIPVGHIADRRGARGIYLCTLALGFVAMAGLCVARDFWSFLALASLGAIAYGAGPAARGPLIQEYGNDRPAEFRAYLRAVANIGISVGALLAGWAVQVDTRASYLLLIGGSAAAWAACTGIAAFLPAVAPVRAAAGPRWIALRDRPYLVLTVLDGVMAVQYRVLTAAVPLWVLERVATARWSVSAVMLVNTCLVVLLQVRASRTITTPRAGGIAFRRAGVAFLLACVLFSALAWTPSWLAIPLLLGAAAVHTMGEIWHAGGGFEVSFALAPRHAVGQYQGLFGLGAGLGQAIGPALLIALCINCGVVGWLIVGAGFALCGAVVPVAVRWAERQRPAAVAVV
ncbi:MFS transporter [Nocardia terpenica]|uniref:MFS transporter n=1 Tax=Nocardia terpenica TaxID=455432 RepID=UPI002FE36B9F